MTTLWRRGSLAPTVGGGLFVISLAGCSRGPPSGTPSTSPSSAVASTSSSTTLPTEAPTSTSSTPAAPSTMLNTTFCRSLSPLASSLAPGAILDTSGAASHPLSKPVLARLAKLGPPYWFQEPG